MSELSKPALHVPVHPVRFVTAAALFDGHDAAINIMRRILQAQGAEVVHLGPLGLQDPPHDVDRRVVTVEQRGRGDEAHGVGGLVQHPLQRTPNCSDVQQSDIQVGKAEACRCRC